MLLGGADSAAPFGPDAPIDMRIGGIGGAYFLAEPGLLVIDVEKRDRNKRSSATELRAVLAGPDRKVIQEQTIPDDGLPRSGKLGPPRRVRFSTHVASKGVYALMITVSGDRYGEHMLWGLRTNCPKYLIETSRGHRDARHEEPIVWDNPERPGDVCFLPRPTPLTVEIAGLPPGGAAPAVFDARGTLLGTLRADAQGAASATFAAREHRDAVPWRLHLPQAKGIVQIDGVTRWDDHDRYAHLSLWTPEAGSFFPLHQYRWLVWPYQRTLYGRPGEAGQAAFTVHNNSEQARTVKLQLEFPGDAWPVRLATEQVTLKAGRSCEVALTYTVPADGQKRECRLRATPVEDPEFSTYATLAAVGGPAPAGKPLSLPLVLKPYCHENEQFGYVADFPYECPPYFDGDNRPAVRADGGVATWRDGQWVTNSVSASVRRAAPSGAKLAFDRQGHMYMPGTVSGRFALLDSADGGRTYKAWPLPGERRSGQSLEIETFTGHNAADGPPPVIRYTYTAADAKLFWRRMHDLELLIPARDAQGVSFRDPVLVTRLSLGVASHSGIPSCVVSRGDRIHVVWSEATEPSAKAPGAPAYVATFDRQGRRLGEPALVGYGPPANDVHNTPSITMDSRGFLHVLGGTHGRPFPYARSLQPNTAHAGWTEPVLVGEGLGLTYIGLMCGPDDTLHLVCRYWRREEEPFPASHYATLAHLRKPADGPWETPQVLVVPPLSEYSVFYHRLTIDRAGRLFLSYDYWSTHWFYRNDQLTRRRTLLVSPDAGRTWKLAETADLVGKAR